MGFKRPFDEDDFQEFPLKHPKQVDCCNKLTSFTEVYPCYEQTQKVKILCEGGDRFCTSKVVDGFEYDNRNVESDLAEKEFEISAPLSWFTNGIRERDSAVSCTTICSPVSPGFFEFYFPRRSIIQFADTYSSLLDGSPRRQVPIGPTHQADVPVWDPQAIEKYSSGSDRVGDACYGRLMGDCMFSMPDPELYSQCYAKVGDGRKDCLCPDQGSVRCVQKHVWKARERVRETLGHEKFVQLGLCDMGEVVTQKWTEEEERVFHEVVYSNPVSQSRNFWEHLSVMFPSRTKTEIVSYYFNVFMLRRRAVQNRSDSLEIDSDDDEWTGSGGDPSGVTQFL
ncbi:hypothetical protein U1Q18_016764 [Sarracenia purpurea var. burkii]